MRLSCPDVEGVDYRWFGLPGSKNRFRGPGPDFDRPYVAFLGSSETFGKFVHAPFPAILGDILGVGCANLSAVNAGVDLALRDPAVLVACVRARVTVLAISGAINLSNRYYRVHPRRNDRFVGESNLLRTLYPEVDFTEIHFTRHLLSVLAQDEMKFPNVVNELRTAWLARMKTLIETIDGQVLLLWMAPHPIPDNAASDGVYQLTMDAPLFIDAKMLDELRGPNCRLVELCPSPETLRQGDRGMVLAGGDVAAASHMPTPAFHRQVAEALAPVISDLLSNNMSAK
ncbi:MAG: DUF6473 family protein [Paracoccaceae bacterium]|nr:DUF6473 family protein [Paracoccaceae bacterium]